MPALSPHPQLITDGACRHCHEAILLRPLHRDHYLQGNRLGSRAPNTIVPCYINIAVKEQSMNSVAPRIATTFSIPSTLLRRALLTDATLSAIAGIALVLAAGPVGAFLELPAAALRIAGLIFIPFAAFAGWLGTRPRVRRTLVFVVIVLNLLWAADSVLLLLTGWVVTTTLGEWFVIGHALIIGAIAEMEFLGLRRSTLVESYARL
jgi:hypothetical protein